MALFKILRGESSRLNSAPLIDGYAYFTPDDGKFYIDAALPNSPLNARVIKSGVVDGQTIYRIELKPSLADEATLANRATTDSAGNTISNYIADLSFNYATSELLITRGNQQEAKISIPPLIQVKS